MPVANNAANAISNSIPKWQLALAVCAPVALGLGYMYYKSTTQGELKDRGKGKEKSKSKSKSKSYDNDKQTSIDEDSIGKTIKIKRDEGSLIKAEKYKKLGNDAFGASKYCEAISFYNKAIETCPSDQKNELAKNYQNRAAAYEALEKYNSVRDDCTKALELNPTYTKALLRRARVLEKMNELEAALEDVTAACILEKLMSQSTIIMADRLLKELGKKHAQEHLREKTPVMPSQYFIKTYFSSFQNDPILSEVHNLSNDDLYGLGRAIKLFKAEKYEDIIPICTEELEKNTTDREDRMKLFLLRGTFYLLLGQHDKAIDDLEMIINNDTVASNIKVNALIKRATMFMQIENPERCLADFELAAKINPECGDIYHHRGQINLLLQKVDEAKSDSEKSLKLNPKSGLAYAQKCYVNCRYAAMNNSISGVEKAMNDFEEAFELFPDCCECYTLYAQMLCDSQSFDKADTYFAKAIEKDPRNATLFVHRGLLQLQWTGSIPKAIEYINKALELDDKCEFGYETLGTIEVQRGNLKEAIALFDKALALARTALELTHIFSLQDAAKAQLKVSEKLGPEYFQGLPLTI